MFFDHEVPYRCKGAFECLVGQSLQSALTGLLARKDGSVGTVVADLAFTDGAFFDEPGQEGSDGSVGPSHLVGWAAASRDLVGGSRVLAPEGIHNDPFGIGHLHSGLLTTHIETLLHF